jgi:RIO-like serine/threonine protein kinase
MSLSKRQMAEDFVQITQNTYDMLAVDYLLVKLIAELSEGQKEVFQGIIDCIDLSVHDHIPVAHVAEKVKMNEISVSQICVHLQRYGLIQAVRVIEVPYLGLSPYIHRKLGWTRQLLKNGE